MFNNELTLGIGRGRGRGRGRLAFNNSNTEINSGTWIRGDQLHHPTTSNVNTYLSETPPPFQVSGNCRTFHETVKRDENPKVPIHSPPYQQQPSKNLSSGPSTMYRPRNHSSHQRTTRGQSMHNSQPRPRLYTSSPPRQSTTFSLIRPRSGQITTSLSQQQQDLQNNFRQDLKHVRSVINNSQQETDRSQQNSRFITAYNRNPGSFPRRGNKRPVTSPTEGNSDKVITPKSSTSTGPQSKKNKKKKKSDTESTDSKEQNKTSSLVNPELYQLKISEDKSFVEQTEELISQLEQTEDEKNMRLQVLQDVADIFSPYLPELEPQIYGSSFTNVAFKTSDLDIFLYCPHGQPEYNFVLEKGRLMYKSPKFKNIVRIARARVPVIKATHIETNVDVDISTMSGQAVYNSMLIKHLLSVDGRLRPLAMMISLWAKLNTITGHSRFTSYSIILMLIYYLQKVTPPILPALKNILYSNDENEWPNYFDANKPIENENNSNLAELLKGFFAFYVNFDFEKVVISPYLGEEIPIEHFTKALNELTDDLSLYKNTLNSNIQTPFKITYTIHVQDPIEHNVNTTKGVFLRLMKLFNRCCERFLNTCVDSIPQNKWLPLVIKQTPLKLIDEKRTNILISYPVNDESWFDNFINDFKELLKILLINITEDESAAEHRNDAVESGKRREVFYADASYNVFNKKFRFPLRIYLSGVIPLSELKNQFEIVINRVKAQVVLFKSKFIIEEQELNGRIKVTIIDKNTTGLNSFLSLVTEFKRYSGKILTDIHSLRQLSSSSSSSSSTSLNDVFKEANKVLVMDLDVESQGKLNNSCVDDNSKTVDSTNRQAEIEQVNDDFKAEEDSSN